MASIRRRDGARGTSWAVLYREDGRQKSTTFTDEAAAIRHAERIERFGPAAAGRILDAEDGRNPDAMPTVAEQVARHIDGLSGVQSDTIATYRQILSKIAPTTLGHLPLDAVKREDVAAWIRDQQDEGLAAKTVKNRHALLAAALTRALDDGLIDRNPAARARIRRTERREMTFLTPTEFQIVLARAHPHYHPLLMTLFGTGLRLGEATALRVSDLNLDATPATLTISRAWKRDGVLGPPKTRAGARTISIPGPVVEQLRRITADRAPSDLVFTNMAGGRVLNASLHDLWQRWIADVVVNRRTGEVTHRSPALKKVPRLHDLRHSHASVMIAAGINLFDLKHRLGHESIQTTANTYGHLMPEAQVQAERAASLAFAVALPQIES